MEVTCPQYNTRHLKTHLFTDDHFISHKIMHGLCYAFSSFTLHLHK